jgi:hypothetical protein
MMTDGGVGHVQLVGGAAKTKMTGGGLKGAQRIQRRQTA